MQLTPLIIAPSRLELTKHRCVVMHLVADLCDEASSCLPNKDIVMRHPFQELAELLDRISHDSRRSERSGENRTNVEWRSNGRTAPRRRFRWKKPVFPSAF